MIVVDLGAAPGGWSQMVRDAPGREKWRMARQDRGPRHPADGRHRRRRFHRGRFPRGGRSQATRGADSTAPPSTLCLSDMAPNISGVSVADQARSMHLAELAADFASVHLRPGGAFLIKLFQGRDYDAYLKTLRAGYERVSIRKPKASRARSPEVYALATGKRAAASK